MIETAWNACEPSVEDRAAASLSSQYEPQTLKNRVVLVTGAGRGLGEATCRVLHEAGAIVIAADIRADLIRAIAPTIQCNGKQQTMTLDVGDPGQAVEAMARVLKDFGRIDVLINNAAIDVPLPIEELSVEDWDRIVRTNLRGPFLLCRHAFALMKRRGGGQIVNICSTAARRAWPNASAYHATKWGLLGLSHALHAEGRRRNIKVTAVLCGGMKTPSQLDRFPEVDVNNLQDPINVAHAIRFVLSQPAETVIAEIMVLPMRETSWP